VCEFKESGRESWAECTIIGEFNGKIICGCNQTGAVGYIELEELRPSRTAEQLAAEERERVTDEMYGHTKTKMTAAEVDIQRETCADLYAAGYRLQDPAK
jgi:hypothetical protein